MMGNIERAELARQMQKEGVSLVQIGVKLGVSRQRVHQLLTAPPGKRIKKEPYQIQYSPDPLNAIARAWRGPTTGRLQVRI